MKYSHILTCKHLHRLMKASVLLCLAFPVTLCLRFWQQINLEVENQERVNLKKSKLCLVCTDFASVSMEMEVEQAKSSSVANFSCWLRVLAPVSMEIDAKSAKNKVTCFKIVEF